MNPSLGRNFEAMDPLEWLARPADHIPDPGKRRTHTRAEVTAVTPSLTAKAGA